jgi:serine/threonine protein kinase
VVGKIGEGGMGKVYRARDERLDRDVAIKVLPDEVAQDTERLTRFEREAKLLAQLNHNNIATLFGLEVDEDRTYLVMELVEGETLASRISRGPLPIEDAMTVALQLAEAFEAAHEQGIVHRDLKPANIAVTEDLHLKVLDFGLATALVPQSMESDPSESPTLSLATAAGAILGTAAYMSPEQARGKRVDKRTDIWAFGCCLYETLTGKRPFLGETVSDTLVELLKREPDWDALPEDTPPAIRSLLHRCLEKDQRSRLRDIGEARVVIGDGSVWAAADQADVVVPRPAGWGAKFPLIDHASGRRSAVDRRIARRYPGRLCRPDRLRALRACPRRSHTEVSGRPGITEPALHLTGWELDRLFRRLEVSEKGADQRWGGRISLPSWRHRAQRSELE